MSKANKSGRVFEEMITTCLKANGLSFIPQYTPGIVGAYEESIKVDFFVRQAKGYPTGFYIECRWQDSGGSCERKMSSLVESVRDYYDRPTFIIVAGKSSHKGRRYAGSRVGKKLQGVMTTDHFVSFCTSLCDGHGLRRVQRDFNPNQGKLFST